MKKGVTRLYKSFKPESYVLQIELDPDNMKFSGTVRLTGYKTGRPSKRITLHQKDLKIKSCRLGRGGRQTEDEIEIGRLNTHKKYDELRIHSKTMLYPGQYTIFVEFEGKITDPMNGLYPCYFEDNGHQKKLLATQFESHHAREVFPCIDEPEAKAIFDLAIVAPAKGTVLANMPARWSEVKNGLQSVVFDTSPIMSTYLLAFVYGEIEAKEAKTKNGTLIRAFATKDKIKQVNFALDTAVKCLEFYEDYFKIPYPLPKLDLVALPDFAAGAMENWGLVTYREQCMLYDAKNTSLSVKQYVAVVVCHELAHQWFGNLVTMRWWTDLWLNEGFASWIEYLAMDKLFPDWEMWTQFVVDDQQPALKLDALNNTHPIEVPIHHPDEIRSIFDSISYNKGASVINMLHSYLGDQAFRDGLNHYLTKHAYKNADTIDLWQALEDSSKKPVRDFMHAWTTQPGFPVVMAGHIDNNLSLNQQRFIIGEAEKHPGQPTWPIPILGGEKLNSQFSTLAATFKTATPIKLNSSQGGFYRVGYDAESLGYLGKNIGKHSELDRLGLLADAFETAKAGFTGLQAALDLLKYFEKETNSAVWDIIVANISDIRRVMDDEEVRQLLKPFIIKLTRNELKRLGWTAKTTDSHFDLLLRPTILGLNAGAEQPEVLKKCLELFDQAKQPDQIEADLRGLVCTTAARHGDEKAYKKLLSWHNSTTNSEDKVTLAAALTSFKQPALIKKALSEVNDKNVRFQDAMYWLAYALGNHHAKDLAWQWIKENWSWLDKNLGSDLSFYRIPVYVGRSFSDQKFINDYNQFFKDKTAPALARSIKQGRELLEWQADWRQRDLLTVLEFLKDKP